MRRPAWSSKTIRRAPARAKNRIIALGALCKLRSKVNKANVSGLSARMRSRTSRFDPRLRSTLLSVFISEPGNLFEAQSFAAPLSSERSSSTTVSRVSDSETLSSVDSFIVLIANNLLLQLRDARAGGPQDFLEFLIVVKV